MVNEKENDVEKEDFDEEDFDDVEELGDETET